MNYIKGNFDSFPPLNNDANYAVYKYGLLKYPSYALNYNFNTLNDDLDTCALFSLLVHGNFDKNKHPLLTTITMAPFVYCTLDDFPIPSKEMCQWIQSHSLSIEWCYYITGWSILGNYHLDNLFYCYDHLMLAKRNNIVLNNPPIHHELVYNNLNVISSLDYSEHTDDKSTIDNQRFKFIESTLDNACSLETLNWLTDEILNNDINTYKGLSKYHYMM